MNDNFTYDKLMEMLNPVELPDNLQAFVDELNSKKDTHVGRAIMSPDAFKEYGVEVEKFTLDGHTVPVILSEHVPTDDVFFLVVHKDCLDGRSTSFRVDVGNFN